MLLNTWPNDSLMKCSIDNIKRHHHDVNEAFDEVDSFYDDIDEDELDNYELQ